MFLAFNIMMKINDEIMLILLINIMQRHMNFGE